MKNWFQDIYWLYWKRNHFMFRYNRENNLYKMFYINSCEGFDNLRRGNYGSLNHVIMLTLNLLNYINRIIYLPFLELSIIIFYGNQDESLKLVSQQYRAWSECTEVLAGLVLYWWQRLLVITFRSSRKRVTR